MTLLDAPQYDPARAKRNLLPSYYREGVPRSLIEAASMAKPIIAADSVGTREPGPRRGEWVPVQATGPPGPCRKDARYAERRPRATR